MKAKNFIVPNEALPDSWVDRWESIDLPSTERFDLNDINVFRTDIAICLHVKLSEADCGFETEGLKEIIRDQALDLADWNSYQGYSLPMCCLIQCPKNSSGEWRKVAGNQEWLRGQLSFQIVESDEDAKKRLDLLLNDNFPDIAEVKPLSDQALKTKLVNIANEDDNKLSSMQRDLLREMCQGLDSTYALDGLDQWENGLVYNYKNMLEVDDA